MSEHTPGPWTVTDRTEIRAQNLYRVAVVQHGLDTEANTRLIAAAPDLLTVVEGFRSKLSTYVKVYPGDKELRRLLKECTGVIEKATGE